MKTICKTIFEVNFYELDRAITEFLKSKGFSSKNFDKYGYLSVAENQWDIYESHTFNIDGEIEITGRPFETLRTWQILQLMCKDNLIPKGEYLVKVGW